MRRYPSSPAFFGATPVFGRAEYAKALGRRRSDRAVYALGAKPGGHGRAATGWNVILPADFVERYFDD